MPSKKPETVVARAARRGERTIEIRLHFWPDVIASERTNILPKHAWTSGWVDIARNAAHGLTPGRDLKFNSLLEIPSVLEKCLLAHGVKLIAIGKTKKYMLCERPRSVNR